MWKEQLVNTTQSKLPGDKENHMVFRGVPALDLTVATDEPSRISAAKPNDKGLADASTQQSLPSPKCEVQ